MAAYKALVSFSGVISMAAGDVREIADPAIAADLTRAGYVREMKPKTEQATEPKTEQAKKPAQRRTRKKDV